MDQQTAFRKAQELLNQMTIEEKVAQMTQISYAHCTHEEAIAWAQRGVGSFLHVLGDDARALQQAALHSRLRIPLLFGIDAVHGHCLNEHATIFPSQLSMACGFCPETVEQIGRATAEEVAEDGLHWTFSPVLCLARDPRWGRVDETFGEDPFLAGELGAALVRGYQGNDLSDSESILACAKHYIAYGEAVGARDACDTEITLRKMHEVFLPPFQKTVAAGCATVMTAYGSLDGTPLTIHSQALKTVLRDELGFDGFVVTDWDNVKSLIDKQHVCESLDEASIKAVSAGNDMIMKTDAFYQAAVDACKAGRLSLADVDAAVLRILTIKFRFGLFEHPEKPCRKGRIGCAEHRTLALRAAQEGVVLLKNKGILPLKNAKRIAVIGPSSDDIRAQYGDWTYFTHPQHEPDQITPVRPYTTLLDGVREVFSDAEILYAKGCGFYPDDEADIDGAIALARSCDAIILALGDTVRQTGEHRDRADLALSGRQSELFDALRELHIPLVLTLILSKPLCTPKEAAQADAVLVAFNGGVEGGRALADVLSGAYAPTGRLPISFPVHTGQIPVYYNALPGWHGDKYVDIPQEPLFAFGEGLGYTTFAYDGLVFDPVELCLSVTVRNTGAVAGTETVQVYLRDLVSSVMTPVKRLIAFQKVPLAPGESRRVCFHLQREDFMLIDADECKIAEPGLFRLMAGHSAKDEDLLSIEWRLNETWS